MRALRSILLTLAIIGCLSDQLYAQADPPSPAALRLAAELLVVIHADSLEQDVNEMLASAMPGAAGLMDVGGDMRAVMNEFFAKYLAWDVLKDDYAAAYAEEFTEGELRQLIDFFRTPLGQTWALGESHLKVRIGKITQEKMMPHMAELQEMMMSRMLGPD